MGPVRQNPIQRTVRTAHLNLMCLRLCIGLTSVGYTVQHGTVRMIGSALLPPDILSACTMNEYRTQTR